MCPWPERCCEDFALVWDEDAPVELALLLVVSLEVAVSTDQSGVFVPVEPHPQMSSSFALSGTGRPPGRRDVTQEARTHRCPLVSKRQCGHVSSGLWSILNPSDPGVFLSWEVSTRPGILGAGGRAGVGSGSLSPWPSRRPLGSVASAQGCRRHGNGVPAWSSGRSELRARVSAGSSGLEGQAGGRQGPGRAPPGPPQPPASQPRPGLAAGLCRVHLRALASGARCGGHWLGHPSTAATLSVTAGQGSVAPSHPASGCLSRLSGCLPGRPSSECPSVRVCVCVGGGVSAGTGPCSESHSTRRAGPSPGLCG